MDSGSSLFVGVVEELIASGGSEWLSSNFRSSTDNPLTARRKNSKLAIREAEAQFGYWIHRVDWSEDRHSAMLSGPGYEVRLWFDARDVHAQGRIPLAWKLFEGALRDHMTRAIGRTP